MHNHVFLPCMKPVAYPSPISTMRPFIRGQNVKTTPPVLPGQAVECAATSFGSKGTRTSSVDKHFLRRNLGHVDGGSPSPLQVCLHAQHIIRLFLVIVPHYSLQPTQVFCILSTQSLIDSCLHSQSHKLSPPLPSSATIAFSSLKKEGREESPNE